MPLKIVIWILSTKSSKLYLDPISVILSICVRRSSNNINTHRNRLSEPLVNSPTTTMSRVWPTYSGFCCTEQLLMVSVTMSTGTSLQGYYPWKNVQKSDLWPMGKTAEFLLEELLVVRMVPDRHFRSGSGPKPNRCQTGGPGCQYTRTVNSGTVQSKSLYPSEMRRLLAGCPAGPCIDSYMALVAVW